MKACKININLMFCLRIPSWVCYFTWFVAKLIPDDDERKTWLWLILRKTREGVRVSLWPYREEVKPLTVTAGAKCEKKEVVSMKIYFREETCMTAYKVFFKKVTLKSVVQLNYYELLKENYFSDKCNAMSTINSSYWLWL